MYKLFLTLRYLTRRPLALVAIAALMLSIAALVVAPSVMNGFQTEFHSRVRGTLSDLSIWGGRPFEIVEDPRTEAALLEVPHVKAVAPYLENPALDDHLDRIDYCFLRGVDPWKEEQVSKFAEYLLSPRDLFLALNDHDLADAKEQAELEALAARLELADTVDKDALYRAMKEGDPDDPEKLPGVLVGVFYLKAWGLDVGRTIKLTTANDAREARDQNFRIVGAFRTGFHKNDSRSVVLHLDRMQQFLDVEGRLTGYSLAMDEYAYAPLAKAAIQAALTRRGERPTTLQRLFLEGVFPARVYVKTWEERDQTLLQAVAMEKALIRIITFLIVVASTASIFLVLFMTVHAKVREFGILRAVGGTRSGVLSLFIGQGFLITLLGMAAGLLLGVVFATYINEIATLVERVSGWHPFPPEVYYLEKIPTRIEPMENAVNFAITLALGSVAAFVPGLLAALRPPLRAIRYE